MKSYKGKYEEILEDENIIEAIRKASLGRRNNEFFKKVFSNMDYYVNYMKSYTNSFRMKPHEPKIIKDGASKKERVIIVPDFREQIMHHMIMNKLEPYFSHGMYELAYGSIPGRGAHDAKKIIEKWIRDNDEVKYCLKMDIKKFFNSMPHDILIAKIRKYIKDKRIVYLFKEIISATEHGLPLGFYTSQWLANWYLQPLDHYIKEDLEAPHYIRYMDDMVIFASNKRKLHNFRLQIFNYLKDKLGLTLKENWQVFRFDYIKSDQHYGRCLDFMGFKFFRGRTIIRKNILIKMVRKANKMSKKDRITIHVIRQFLSYLGWVSCTNTYGMYLTHIKPLVIIQYCKRRISYYDRREAEKKRSEKYDRLENIWV